jgi:solute carrier family 40 (iron-regulated transporter), member 1
MSFGTLMTSYLKWAGMGEARLAMYRALGAASGIAATVAFPPLQRAVGLPATGAVAVWLQLACLVGGAAPSVVAWAGGGDDASHGSAPAALAWGLVLSRFGLWTFDLAANQVVQETVAPGSLGTVNGVQSSLQNAFQMASYVAGTAVWQPERFPALMLGSCCVVGAAAATFSAWAARRRCTIEAFPPDE